MSGHTFRRRRSPGPIRSRASAPPATIASPASEATGAREARVPVGLEDLARKNASAGRVSSHLLSSRPMSLTYTVVQGDCISSIAAQNGFGRWQTVWDRPENAALKKTRKNPNALSPGDQVFVPD